MTDPLSEERLTQIRARAEAATAGPWHREGPDADYSHAQYGNCCGMGDFGWVTGGPNFPRYDEDSEEAKADAEFIAHSRTDVVALLDEIHRLREENEALIHHEQFAPVEMARVAALQARIDNALALHQRRDRLSPRDLDGASCHGCCDHCCNAGDGEWTPHVAYPCATVAALTGQDPT